MKCRALRLAVHHAARAQVADELPLQIVGRAIDLRLEIRQHVADADVDVLAFREDVGVAVARRRSRRTRTASRAPPRAAPPRAFPPSCRARAVAGGQPGFIPRRRAMTLLTPSAAMTIGARSSRPSRVRSVTPSASCARLRDRRPAPAARRPASMRQRREQVVEFDAPDQEDGRAARLHPEHLAGRALRDTGSTPDVSGSV